MGPEGPASDWYALEALAALRVAAEESLRRVTVSQETNPARPGVDFRRRRARRAQTAATVPEERITWPKPVEDLTHGFRFRWSNDEPHCNVEPLTGGHPAAFVYLGENVETDTLENVYTKLKRARRKHAFDISEQAGVDPSDPVTFAEDRLCVVYRRNHTLEFYKPPEHASITATEGCATGRYCWSLNLMLTEQIVEKLEHKYPHLERVTDAVFRGVDEYKGHPFAIRYFDLDDKLLSTASQLNQYQDRLLGRSYFDVESKADLRWNHYLYFVVPALRDDKAFLRAKAIVESDREYARKIVIAEEELETVLDQPHFGADPSEGPPKDPLSLWTETLNNHDLGFVIDEKLQVPAVIRHIAEGDRRTVIRPPAKPQLDRSEEAVSNDQLANIEIRNFRAYPAQRTFNFGLVNLILGVNGAGKTSLLEAIEYLFCGKTRRVGSVLPHTDVSGSLARSKLTLQTKSMTSKARLRSRHLVWYGKSELKTVTLQDSFAKFNFLDTDAAVRLSVERRHEHINDDLAQLLLGTEASKALDRFERVASQLKEQKKSIQNKLHICNISRSDTAERLELLRDAPQESDSLFSDLAAGLRDAEWLQLPPDKHQTEQLAESLQSALVDIAILSSAGHTTSSDFAALDAKVQTLTASEQTIDRLSTQEHTRRRENVRSRQRLERVTKRLEAIETLAQVVGSGVSELHRKRQSLERQLRDRAALLSEAEAAVRDLPSESSIRREMLSIVAIEWTKAVRTAEERFTQAKNALQALELTQNILSSLRQRLRSSAQEIIEHTGDTTHCPLCQAEYSEADLENRIGHLTERSVAAESERLRTELQTAESMHKQRVLELTAVRTLERYLRADSPKTSLAAAIRQVTKASERAVEMVAELNTVTESLQAHEKNGWTIQRLTELASTAEIEESDISPDGIEAARAVSRDEQKHLLNDIKSLEYKAQEAATRTAEIGITYGLTSPTLSDLAQIVSERRKSAEDSRRSVQALSDQLTLSRTKSISDLEARLREAHAVTIRLRTAVAKEQKNTEAIETESKLIDDADTQIKDLRVNLRRVENARTLLDDLLDKQSARVLAENVLRENAARISSTFAKIHAPNEFDLKVFHDDLTIVRRGVGNASLNEMSSGQRAAFALSLFLAMNECLTVGPKIILLDDPVAHVDDINTLSLLDHLRDIALSGERQIFFATANAKIGALFGRKFRFLGDDFVQIQLTRD